jgi:APA family basic amino acid/polyamine antiporter
MDLFRKKEINNSLDSSSHLLRCLSVFDLTFLGVGAIIGAGIFVLTGIVAATQTGPAIVFSYIVAGLACAFSALSYAELAAAAPMAMHMPVLGKLLPGLLAGIYCWNIPSRFLLFP